MTGKARFGVRIYTHKGTNWAEWFHNEADQDKCYRKNIQKAGMEKSRKTPYRIVKKVTR